jgi:phosphate acetyltransferase
MGLIHNIRNKASGRKNNIIFPETEDIRVIKAASELINKSLTTVTLIGDEQQIKKSAATAGIDLEGVHFLNFESEPNKDEMINYLAEKNSRKNLSREDSFHLLKQPLIYAAVNVALGKADAAVAGSIATTGDVIKAGLTGIGVHPDSKIVSSIFLMEMPDGKSYTYADCAVVPKPDSEQLSAIAIDSAKSHSILTGDEPRIAFLSFSTKGSAKHEMVDLVREAFEITKNKMPQWKMDGELQFDTALIPEIAKRKAPESELKGDANVFIFPNLDAANIGYKITERLAGATATGPLLQGLAKPFMDLSRGCTWEDIVNVSCVASLLVEKT